MKKLTIAICFAMALGSCKKEQLSCPILQVDASLKYYYSDTTHFYSENVAFNQPVIGDVVLRMNIISNGSLRCVERSCTLTGQSNFIFYTWQPIIKGDNVGNIDVEVYDPHYCSTVVTINK